MKYGFQDFPVTLPFSPLEQLAPFTQFLPSVFVHEGEPCTSYRESLSPVMKKHAYVGALGTPAYFLQAFPAASNSEISFIEWSQGVCFCVCV